VRAATDSAHGRAEDIARLAILVLAAFGGAAAGAALMVGAPDFAPALATAVTATVTAIAAVQFEPISGFSAKRWPLPRSARSAWPRETQSRVARPQR
jgi:hypothetical protein